MRWLAAACLLASSAVARADDAAVKKALQANYDAFNKAFVAKDANAVAKMAAPGFTSKGPDGKVKTAEQSLAGIKMQMFMAPRGSKVTTTITKLSVKGDKATADSALILTATVTETDKKEHKLFVRANSRDTWTKIGNDWKILLREEQAQVIMRDGKKFDRTGGAKP
jgi:ketosteroid isomerase-like protein